MSLRVALIYDSRPRPDTTGIYCQWALQSLAEVTHLLPDQLGSIHPGDFDLFIWVDDGLEYRWPQHLQPAVYWAIDTHLNFPRSLARSQPCGLVLTAQKNGREQLRQHLSQPVEWLPLGCDPNIHQAPAQPKQYDFGFVGHLFPGPRQELLHRLQQEFPKYFVGRADFRQMAQIYAQSRIVFNRSIRDDLNMRVFEALASGSMLLTNALPENGLPDLLADGQHLVTYQSEWELLEQMHWYLEHPHEREQIAQAGQQAVLEKHTYQHRMQRLLELAEVHLLSDSAQPPAESVDRHSHFLTRPERNTMQDSFLKTADYYQHERRDVLALVPAAARRILDVGCGSGRLGELIQQRQPAEIVGVELNPPAVALARDRLSEVHELDLDQPLPDWEPGSFEAIIAADILEHLQQPEQLLKQLRTLLSEEGQLIVSLPNVRHHSVIRSLLDGNWTYESAGLLDEDHLRFFTRREIEKLFFRCGLEITHWQIVPGSGYPEWTQQGQPQEARIGGLSYRGRNVKDTEELFAYQFLLVAEPAPVPTDELTSIILVTHNQWSFTRQCLESLRRLTDEPYELIVVDNASTDETVSALKDMLDVQLIENSENRGFPAAVNQGLRVATGEQVLLLNNDTLLTTGWLRRLLDALYSEESIGLVGPVSNNVSGPQQISVGYEELNSLDGFAWDWSRDHRGRISDLDRLVGFCLLIQRPVLEQIGEFDERFGIGNFEDDDYCRRAQEAGFRTVVAWDAFVHHFGSQTFRNTDIDFHQLLEENERKYQEKWGEETPGNGERPLLSLCMIVRDNEDTIRPALESIRPYVDEMIVVDTGSVDQTPEIVQELGARLFYFEWCDDFSAARNESLQHASGEWIFWMDSDDTIPADCGEKLRQLVEGGHSEQTLGYVMQVHCPGPQDQNSLTVVDHVKLFRNRPDLRFEGRIHEQILGRIRRAGGEVEWSEVSVVHSGSDQSEAGRQRKRERDLRILQREYEDQPKHPFVLFNLGMTYADGGQHEPAVEYLQQCLEVSQPQESHLRKAYALLVGSLNQLGRREQAEEVCDQGLELYPADTELLFRRGTLHQNRQEWPAAEQCYLRLLEAEPEQHFSSRDQGLTGYKAHHNLALLYSEQQQWQQAERSWREALNYDSTAGAAWRGLGEAVLAQQESRRTESLLSELQNQPELAGERCLLQARYQQQQGNTQEAIQTLRSGIQEHPNLPELTEELVPLLAGEGQHEEAIKRLTDLLKRFPERPGAWHNLGSLHAQQQNWSVATQAFEQSLKHRPDYPPTILQLGHAQQAAGQEDQARQTWETGLETHPDHPGLLAALQTLPLSTSS